MDQSQAQSAQQQVPPQELEKLQTAFDNGIWYALGLWQALAVAIQNGWGGSETLEKRDWFAGAVSSLILDHPETDQEDLEIFLLQIMEDEFDCRVEDETEIEVAKNIMGLRVRLLRDGDMSAFSEVEQRWKNRGQMKGDVRVTDQTDADADDDDDEDEHDVENGGVDVDMDDAPALVAAVPVKKPEPVIDEDGFTKVVSKKKR